MNNPSNSADAKALELTPNPVQAPPGWAVWTLRVAAIYNLAWALYMMAAPNAWWDWLGLARPNYIFLWSGTGLFVGLFGVGYWIASRDPARHWGLIVVGLASKVLAFLGSLNGCFVEKNVPPAFAVAGIFNDVILWVPFGAILWWVWRGRGLRH